ncbi:MAG: 50S ribosomal protein L23 [Actinobacteria bacterium]|nr:50S ribosomal protein L23 [Actinomycetota bacterium]MCG2818747.1 50S ribosomal protein L23 [Actinomycetes bacterium]MBU4217680.1 50S ribosomal protein L23 [Actinomycetota bacterium]MBU4359007.1 50S ribosomal protein L23 [Actinomycetota bacterium]MBU4391652.1 50S ribosomal protein L23 [Actinomycetota bacterium]
MKHPHDVIFYPIISEKSYSGIDHGKYTFMVDHRCNKSEIKDAVQEAFDVRVVKVNTMNTKGKPRRRGMTVGRTATGKKAVVTLAPGQSIEFFESR